jgi:phosphoribosylanthranilate isomerase
MHPVKMHIKICGMKDPVNIREISTLSPDYMGFIYYPGSKRFAGELESDDLSELPSTIKKVGVFVNTPVKDVLEKAREMDFVFLQLHGDESPGYCLEVKKHGFKVIKVFPMVPGADLSSLKSYMDVSDLFLFDTAGEGYGGTGRKFNWNLLEHYNLAKPFLLSGGIQPDDLQAIIELEHPQLYGLDLNSGFEINPGFKDPEKLAGFMNELRKGQ